MKKAVIIAPYFPPRRRVGSIRPFRFVRYLSEFGYESYVVFIEDKTAELSPKEREALKDVHLIPIKSPFDNTAASGSSIQKSPGRARKKTTGGAIDNLFPMDTWWPLFILRKKRIFRELDKIRPDILWSTADPWSSHWLALKLKKKLNIPWVADFRDPWTLCNIRGKEKPLWVRGQEARFENEFIHEADRIVFTAEETSRKYREFYPDAAEKITTVYNSFDDGFYSDTTEVIRTQNSDRLYVYFFGKFRDLSPVEPVLNMLKIAREKDAETASRIEIIMNGPLSEKDRLKVASAGMEQFFKAEQPVLYEESRAYLRQADLLLLSTSPQRDDIIPAKLWDYMAARRPVLAISSNQEVHGLINRHVEGAAFHPERTAKAADFLLKMAADKKSGESRKTAVEDFQNTDMFDSRNTTRQLSQIFNEVISGNKHG